MKKPKSIQINIPQPCQEDWSKMTPQQQGRFCNSCQKCVVDFTNFSDEELYIYLLKHKGEKVCGRLGDWQLKRQITAPVKLHNRAYQWFLSLSIIVFLTSILTNDAKAQTRTKVKTELNPDSSKTSTQKNEIIDSANTVFTQYIPPHLDKLNSNTQVKTGGISFEELPARKLSEIQKTIEDLESQQYPENTEAPTR